MRTWFWFVVISLGLFATASTRAVELEKPNVLFIAIDDLNDWIGKLEGHPQTLTPKAVLGP